MLVGVSRSYPVWEGYRECPRRLQSIASLSRQENILIVRNTVNQILHREKGTKVFKSFVLSKTVDCLVTNCWGQTDVSLTWVRDGRSMCCHYIMSCRCVSVMASWVYKGRQREEGNQTPAASNCVETTKNKHININKYLVIIPSTLHTCTNTHMIFCSRAATAPGPWGWICLNQHRFVMRTSFHM